MPIDVGSRLAELGRSLFVRGLTSGSSGNLSIRTELGWLATPTDTSLGDLVESSLAAIDASGRHMAGPAPTKEWPLHAAIYESRPDLSAVVHLHCPHAVAVSCISDVDPADVLPILTPYYRMKVRKLPLVPYFPPGSNELAQAVGEIAGRSEAFLLANHGPVIAGTSLEATVYAIEELEATARLYLMLRGLPYRTIPAD